MIKVEKKAVFTGHNDCVYSILSLNKEGDFVSAGGDGMIVRWNIEKQDYGKLLAKVNRSVYALCYVAEKQDLIIGENSEGIHKIDLNAIKEVGSVQLKSPIFDIKVFDNQIFVASADGLVTIFDYESLALNIQLKVSDKSIRALAINEKAGHLAIASSDYSIKILDLRSFQLLYHIIAHENSVFSLSYSPNFQYLISGSRDAHLKFWDCNNNYQMVEDIVAHLFAINHISFSPNGKLFATCSVDKTIKIWDTSPVKLLKVVDRARHAGHGTSINKLFWMDDSHFLSCSDDRTITYWELEID